MNLETYWQEMEDLDIDVLDMVKAVCRNYRALGADFDGALDFLSGKVEVWYLGAMMLGFVDNGKVLRVLHSRRPSQKAGGEVEREFGLAFDDALDWNRTHWPRASRR